MVELIFIKLHQQLQELSPLEEEGGEGEDETTLDRKYGLTFCLPLVE